MFFPCLDTFLKSWLSQCSSRSHLHHLLHHCHHYCSDTQSCPTPWPQASLSLTVCQSLFKLTKFIELVMPFNHFILCHPFSSCLQSFLASRSFLMSQLFASGGQSIGALAISLSNEYSGLISFRIDWFDLLAVQGTVSSLLQDHSSKASILWCLAFFMVQL